LDGDIEEPSDASYHDDTGTYSHDGEGDVTPESPPDYEDLQREFADMEARVRDSFNNLYHDAVRQTDRGDVTSHDLLLDEPEEDLDEDIEDMDQEQDSDEDEEDSFQL
jgi:hypothetical protein